MKSTFTVVVAALAVGTGSLSAQGGSLNAQCRSGTIPERVTQDACQKAVDIFQFMAPQLGVSIVGGNATLGQGSTLGGPGHFSVGIRANVLNGRIPQVEDVTPAIIGAVAADYEVKDQIIGLPVVDAAIGVFPGLPLGGTRILALDALVNFAYVPDIEENDFSIKPTDGSVKFGFGARVGLLQESVVTPGISFSYLRRDVPTVTISATPGSDRITVRDLAVETDAWRIVAGKSFYVLGIAVGGGQDRVDASAIGDVSVSRGGITATAGPIAARQKQTRSNIFLDVSLNLSLLKIVGEVGRQSGGDEINTYNTFSGKKVNDALNYASLGLRLGF